MNWPAFLLALLVGVFSTAVGAADLSPVPCSAQLTPAQEARVQAAISRIYVYDGCDGTIASCMGGSTSSLPRRLAGEVCRRVKAGESDESITRALDLRSRSMMPAPAAAIDLVGTPMIGEANAPVVLVEYACLRCPFCARLTPEIVREIREGSLRGKVRLYYKLFPIKGHTGSTEAGLAALVAQDRSRFWEFLLLSYQRFDTFSVENLSRWGAEVGLSGFDASFADPALRDRLVASKKEGMANGVKSTPTFFISGRMWQGDLSVEMLLDVLGEEYERGSATR